jgi:hypothetical protein
MVSKDFDHTVKFHEVTDPGGNIIAQFPIVETTLIGPTGQRRNLPLLFDTGASVTTLIHSLYPLLGLHSWDEGIAEQTGTANKRITVYRYMIDLELFGKVIRCPVHLSQGLEANPIFMGLLGRDTIFNEFGFGFWESTHELFVTANP